MPDGIARLALRLGIDGAEYLLQAGDVRLGLAMVLLECGLQFRIARSLRHLRKRAQDLLLGEVDVLQGVAKQLVQFFGFSRHLSPP